MKQIDEIIKSNRSGGGLGMFSVCSALPEAIEAGLAVSRDTGCLAVIESTSNQVDQNGGYTGMTPEDFAAFVKFKAEEVGADPEKIVLGGDHLGPNGWKNEPEASAMDKAEVLVRECVRAGYRKIHLDASMMLADDNYEGSILPDEVVASRAARLCAACEEEWKAAGGDDADAPVYIIGTEVPVPGGTEAEEEGPEVTGPAEAEQTIGITKEHFISGGLDAAWERVIGLVVQPGVEFSDTEIYDYDREKAAKLSSVMEKYPGMVFEAHSTDYQTPANLRRLVEDHFAILKVGPWLTFVYREALFLLHEIEREVMSRLPGDDSNLKELLWSVMSDKPKYWEKYYHGTAEELRYKAYYSLSDRSRYYWPDPVLVNAVKKLYINLRDNGIPMALLSQYFPDEYDMVREGKIENLPCQIINQRLMRTMKIYASACGYNV